MKTALLLLLALGCQRERTRAPEGTMVVFKEQEAAWVRNFNPLLATGGARWPTVAGIYEPLLIHNVPQGTYVPWLATDHAWFDGGRILKMTIREGVRWSDGAPMGPDDVVFTFQLLREHKALDAGSVWRHLSDVHAEGDTVVFTFETPHTPSLSNIAYQPIVPEHVWRTVADPVRFTNPDPVATGPFTEIVRFDSQVWELGKNDDYWGEGPHFDIMRFPAIQTNDQASIALIRGEIDWAGKFVPAVDRVFVGRDPEHHHYWFPLMGGTVFLYPNNKRPPFDDLKVRRALDLAIDRELVVRVAMYGYSKPSHSSGLSDSYASWRDPALPDSTFDPDRAHLLLDQAGLFVGEDGYRRQADGTPLSVEIEVVSAWSDWVRAAQVVAANLRDVGIDARMKPRDFGAWFERLTRGETTLAVAWSTEGPSPYHFYSALMGPDADTPLGESASNGWARHASPAMGALLDQFAASTDEADKRALALQMQQVFRAELPAVPLFPNPSWGECNTERFVGWPSEADPYARLSPNNPPEPLLVMTRVRPR